MRIRSSIFAVTLAASFFCAPGIGAHAQLLTPAAASAPTAVPALVPYSGMAVDGAGKPLDSESHLTFLIYKEEQGGEPLWVETQTVAFDNAGHYKVNLGATYTKGLPSDLFASGEARWLEVQIAGEKAQPRVLLVSVPYALKAADAATLGGLPASAFALAGTNLVATQAASQAISPDATTTVTTTGGTAGALAKFAGTSSVSNSIIFDNGAQVGIGRTPNTAAVLDVAGATVLQGNLSISQSGSATSSAGAPSHSFIFNAGEYSSSSKGTVGSSFQWKAEPTNNNTASPSATLNLLSSQGTASVAETGLYINSNGFIHFTTGQTFGANALTLTAVTGTSKSGEGVGGTSTSGTGVAGTSSSGNGVVGDSAGTTLNTSGILGIAGTRNTSGFGGIAGAWGDANAHVGVLGTSTQYSGVQGISMSGPGVQGQSTYTNGGEFTGGDSGNGVSAMGGTASGSGVPGMGGYFGGGNVPSSGSANGGIGVYAVGGSGSSGYSSGIGIEATGGYSDAADGDYGGLFDGGSSNSGLAGGGIYSTVGVSNTYGDGSYAGNFYGDVYITGTLTADSKDFKIDHPSDPANKYLVHASVESSEMMNIYTGNVTTDELGLATVTLPTWFQTLNTDFRYQLTVVGGRFAQAIVSKEIEKNKFTISTNASGVKVSWQVTAVRQDAYAKAHPLVVEQTKSSRERGFYKHPELYGQPEEKQIEWGTHPQTMRRLKAQRQKRMGIATSGKSASVRSVSQP